jgi:hypothetical protein
MRGRRQVRSYLVGEATSHRTSNLLAPVSTQYLKVKIRCELTYYKIRDRSTLLYNCITLRPRTLVREPTIERPVLCLYEWQDSPATSHFVGRPLPALRRYTRNFFTTGHEEFVWDNRLGCANYMDQSSS